MPTKIICPDCGGVIGEITSDTEVACHCAQQPLAPTIEDYRQASAAAGSDSESDLREGSDGGAKVCRICGKDVTGQKRYKDSLGYWCADCHNAEKAGRVAGKKRCSSCHRLFPIEKLIESDDERLCSTCNRERNNQRRQVLRQAAKKRTYQLYEQKRLLMLAGVFLVLLIIIVMQQLGWIGSRG